MQNGHVAGLSPKRAQAVALYLKGVSISEIERKSGVLRKEMYMDLKKQGIERRRANPFRKPASETIAPVRDPQSPRNARALIETEIDERIAKKRTELEDLTRLRGLLAVLD
jgi:hypothetical protein